MEQTRGTGSKTEEERRLPAWDSLPDIDLYMDQVLLLVDRSLRGFLATQSISAGNDALR